MSFLIEYDNQPRKFLKKYDKHIVKRILTKIKETLSNNPVPHDAKTIVYQKTQNSEQDFVPFVYTKGLHFLRKFMSFGIYSGGNNYLH